MPEIVVDLDDGRGPQPAEQALASGPRDLGYFVLVAQTAAQAACDVERFVISYSRDAGRLLTPRDVWLMVGDERATPLPGKPPCPVFQTYGERFGVPARRLRSDPVLRMAELALWTRNELSAMWRNRPDPFPRRRRKHPGWLPLGMPAFGMPPPSVPDIEERPIDVGFHGSTASARRYSPKTISRRRMVSALAELPADVRVELTETESFLTSYAADPRAYVQALLETKICLAPRGGSLETFRVFEGAAAGCVLITEPLPPAWFYAGLPRVQLQSWSELPGAVGKLRSNPVLMRQMAHAAREWALTVVNPHAVGQWVARQVEEW